MIKNPIKKYPSFKEISLSILFGIIFASLFSFGMYVFAIPPASPYAPGDTLNPNCAAGTTNCTVTPPVPYTGANSALNLGIQNFSTAGITTLGAEEKLKYNASNYATFTTDKNGNLTIETKSSTTGGNINLNSAVIGDAAILSNSGTLVFGALSGANNEGLKFDFETYKDKVAITSNTGVTTVDLGSLNLVTTGNLTLGASTPGTLVTRVKAGAATESDANGSLVVDSINKRLYFRYGSAWHYIAETAGFQIPDFETIDPISGEQIKEGDIVLGMVNKTYQDNSLHGVWVKAVNAISSFGIIIKDGLINISNLATEKFSAKTARIDRLEMVDKATGDIYCAWIENGEWQKAKGECGLSVK